MNKTLYGAIILSVFLQYAKGSSFDSVDENVQQYIVRQLGNSLRDYDIVVLYDSVFDKLNKIEGELPLEQLYSLDLVKSCILRVLKGSSSLENVGHIYLYRPFDKNWNIMVENESRRLPPYMPIVICDERQKLALIKRQDTPLLDRVADRSHGKEMKDFVEDAKHLSAAVFVKKHALSKLFDQKTFTIVEGCVFQVSYPVTNISAVSSRIALNKLTIEKMRSRAIELQKDSNLIQLTSREVSEVVFLAFLMSDQRGVKQYADSIRSDDPVLQPVDVTKLKTRLGQLIYKYIKDDIDAIR